MGCRTWVCWWFFFSKGTTYFLISHFFLNYTHKRSLPFMWRQLNSRLYREQLLQSSNKLYLTNFPCPPLKNSGKFVSCDFPYKSQARPSPLHHLYIALTLMNSLCQPDGHTLSVIKAHRGKSCCMGTPMQPQSGQCGYKGVIQPLSPQTEALLHSCLSKCSFLSSHLQGSRTNCLTSTGTIYDAFILLRTINAALYQLVESQHSDAKLHSIWFNYFQVTPTPTSLLTTSSLCSRITGAFRFTFSLLSIVATENGSGMFVQKYI